MATITLNRPGQLNTIVPPMPDEIEAAVERRGARSGTVKVIILRGAGRSFCGGFDFGDGFHHWDEYITTDGEWDPGKDFMFATAPAVAPTQKFMSLWRSPKPVIAQVHGWCVGGGSDYALCADLVIASEDARIGTPYSRMWGSWLSGMWLYRLGLTKAKEFALTGKPLSGRQAADCRPHQLGRAVRRARGHGAAHRDTARVDPAVAAVRDEADREPGLREHGPGGDADARPHPRRPDAQHAGGEAVHRDRRASKACARPWRGATARSATTARRRKDEQPDPGNVITP